MGIRSLYLFIYICGLHLFFAPESHPPTAEEGCTEDLLRGSAPHPVSVLHLFFAQENNSPTCVDQRGPTSACTSFGESLDGLRWPDGGRGRKQEGGCVRKEGGECTGETVKQ